MSTASTAGDLANELDKLHRIFGKWKHVFDDSTKLEISAIFDKIGHLTKKQFVTSRSLDDISSASQTRDHNVANVVTSSDDETESKEANTLRDIISASVLSLT